MMALPVPENFNLEYKAPSKESVEEGKDDTDKNNEMVEYNHDPDETSVVNASRLILSR